MNESVKLTLLDFLSFKYLVEVKMCNQSLEQFLKYNPKRHQLTHKSWESDSSYESTESDGSIESERSKPLTYQEFVNSRKVDNDLSIDSEDPKEKKTRWGSIPYNLRIFSPEHPMVRFGSMEMMQEDLCKALQVLKNKLPTASKIVVLDLSKLYTHNVTDFQITGNRALTSEEWIGIFPTLSESGWNARLSEI